MKTNLHPEVLKFFKEQGTILNYDSNEQYLYYPYWLKTLPDGKVEIIDWDKIPSNLKEMVTDKRNGQVSFINGKFTTNDPELIEELKNHPRNKSNKPSNHE